jgi:hypothetical protein
MKPFIISIFFILSLNAQEYSRGNSFFVWTETSERESLRLVDFANLEVSRNSDFCRGFWMPKGIGKWKCQMNEEGVRCLREYFCERVQKNWNRVTESIKYKRKIASSYWPEGLKVYLSKRVKGKKKIVKKRRKKNEDNVSTALAATDKNDNKLKNVYIVRGGDTLMFIAFKLYGDWRRWKELRDMNAQLLNGGDSLIHGMELQYYDEGNIVMAGRGRPYLIKWGDNLHHISRKVYGKESKWKKLWKNNTKMIIDPNLIFAGFFLFYEREDKLSSQELALNINSFGY